MLISKMFLANSCATSGKTVTPENPKAEQSRFVLLDELTIAVFDSRAKEQDEEHEFPKLGG
jgi:hypothetical protein